MEFYTSHHCKKIFPGQACCSRGRAGKGQVGTVASVTSASRTCFVTVLISARTQAADSRAQIWLAINYGPVILDHNTGEEFRCLGRAQIGARGTLPSAAAAGLLDPADIVPGAGRQVVDVLVIFEADFGPGLDDLLTQGRLVGGARGQQRPALAVKLVGPTLPIFGLLEVRQHVVPRPAAIAELA